MKHGLLIATLVAALSLSMLSPDAEAKRIGGGGSAGMKRTVPTQPASPPTQQSTTPQGSGVPAQQAAPSPAPTGAAAPAAAPKRSWMGPIAGLAAGLGLAALASHFGFGGALANVMTMLLIGVALMLVVGFVMRRFAAKPAQGAGLKYAGAGAGADAGAGYAPAAAAAATAPLAAAPVSSAEDEEFVQVAKRVFIRLQAANDAGDQNDLRKFTTPEMYAAVQHDLLDRKGAQRTDVLQLNAQLLDRAQEPDQQVVSVRFWGLIREQSEAAAESFDEIWHLVRPQDGSREWAIAGIQQTQ
ncbi:TIM44-like domain-containing protein [Paucibacter sediminis]|uniref:TIM44-like domain-containing protein n=1 Tax=Paucibacter sediminis TaxID=3019553 RepID=A0AA95NJB2_9BURK|nr:TIM44-like domain-containing protein [Paucibacter sp. S2-9]WIT10571.1 TIM44-like domain-containing protein [Paucibacter sp. S2-9]